MRTVDFVTRLTVEQALLHARKVAYTYNDTVLATINGIVMIVNKGTDVNKAMAEYQQKNNLKNEIARLKAIKVK
ncbi:MAG: hypothetical protein IK122_01480 [Alphaproteobacteria bacterium]|nr:hypothetical protein [Alphaproteobacteria bacterium]